MSDIIKDPILVDIPMPIETPRLILRNVLPGDGTAMFEAKKESLDELKPWMPWARDLGTEDDSEIVARKAYANFILRKDMMMLGFEKASGKLIISTGLHRFDWGSGFISKSAIGSAHRKQEKAMPAKPQTPLPALPSMLLPPAK